MKRNRYTVRKNTLPHPAYPWCIVDTSTGFVVATRNTRAQASHYAKLLSNY